MVKERRNGQMDQDLKGVINGVRSMDKVSFSGQIRIYIKDNLNIIWCMEVENIFGKIEKDL